MASVDSSVDVDAVNSQSQFLGANRELHFWSKFYCNPALYLWIDKWYPNLANFPKYEDFDFNRVLPNFETSFGQFPMAKTATELQTSISNAVWHDHSYSKAHLTKPVVSSAKDGSQPVAVASAQNRNYYVVKPEEKTKCHYCHILRITGACPVSKYQS